MLVVAIGLVCALIYGAGDYVGGIASRRISPVRVVGFAGLIGLLLLAALSPLVGGVYSPEALLWGALSGVAGSVAIITLYWALAIGPMSILSPLTAVISAIVPLAWAAVLGERLSVIGYVALGIALVAVVLVGFVPEKTAVRPSLKGVVVATVSGVLIGILLILLHAAPVDSGLLPLVFNRMTYLTIVWVIVLVLWLRSRRGGASFGPPARTVLWPIIGAGIADASANTLLIIGFRLGDLSVIAVLAALYPAGTIVLAAVFLKERIAVVQWIGLGLALVAAGMLALA